jgi:hypothetical protein
LIADLFVTCVAQQTPQLMLPLGERDEVGDIVAAIVIDDRFVRHSHPFDCRACGSVDSLSTDAGDF